MTDRPSLDDTLMDVAEVWGRRATCSRLHVGAVLAKDGYQLAQGYNGAPAGLPHCTHELDASCAVSVHGEANVIANAARLATLGSTMYVTHAPCAACASLIINAGISAVCYRDPYRSEAGLELLALAGVDVRKMR